MRGTPFSSWGEIFMLAPRGWWFLAFVFALALVAVAFGVSRLVFILLTLLAWFGLTWLGFNWRTRRLARLIDIDREVLTSGGPAQTLWARVPATVRVRVGWRGSPLGFVLAIDKTPPLANVPLANNWTRGPLTKKSPLVIEYRIDCPAAGRLRFEGVKIVATDLQGFFHQTVFIRRRFEVRVLPPLVEGPHTVPSRKRHNLIPLAGTHRLIRPGGGSELIDLRDYTTSDPPKLIAWKPSARRDRLIVKELESEVPVRCTLFVDASTATRLGPVGRNALARLVDIAAGVLYGNSEARDLTGLVILDEKGIGRRLNPARGQRAFYQMLHLLADIADEPPSLRYADITRLLPFAMGLAQDVYPDWLGRDVNHTPVYSPRFWFRENRWRKKISAIIANHERLGPGGVSMLYHENETFELHLTGWLSEHRVAVPTMLYDDDGRYLFRNAGKIPALARAVTESVARAKDNELFVLLVDLLDIEADRGPLLRAVKTARARHHQVQVVIPWPPGVPLPDKKKEPPRSLFMSPDLQELLSRVWTSQLHQAIGNLRREFGKVGVPVIAAADELTVPAILEQMQRLRQGSHRR